MGVLEAGKRIGTPISFGNPLAEAETSRFREAPPLMAGSKDLELTNHLRALRLMSKSANRRHEPSMHPASPK